jgi:hypothetical protein
MFSLALAHFIGDFVLQSTFIAERKLQNFLVCIFHVLVYSIPFYFLVSTNWTFLGVIAITHLIMDFLRIAEFVSYLKNVLINHKIWILDKQELQRYSWFNCKYGYPKDVPEHLASWLLIIVDQILHIISNAFIYYVFIGKA